MSRIEQGLDLPPFCGGLFQREKKNANVFVQQLDRVAGTLPEVLPADCWFSVPRVGLWLSFMNGPSHQLDSLLDCFWLHDHTSCVRAKESQCLPSCQMLASRRLAPMKEPKDAAKRIDAR
jgi:hypothetical protein